MSILDALSSAFGNGSGGYNSNGLNPLFQAGSNIANASLLNSVGNFQSGAANQLKSLFGGLGNNSLSGPGGMSVGFSGGGGSGSSPTGSSPFINLGGTLGNAYDNYSNAAATPIAGTQGMLGQLFGSNGAVQNGAGALMGAGFGQLGNPTIGNAFANANTAMNNAGADFGSAYNTAYNALMGPLQRQEQLAQSALNDSQFQRGQLGSTGGALQTEAFARGLGQANAGVGAQALAAGQNAYNSDINAAGALSGIGNSGLSLGNSLLANAFSQFNNTNAIGNNLANSIFNQNQAINSAGLSGVGALNNLGLNNFNSLLNYANANNAAQRSAGSALGNLSTQQNFVPGAGYANVLGNILGDGNLGSILGSILGNGSANGGGGLGSLINAGKGIYNGVNSLFGGGFDPTAFANSGAAQSATDALSSALSGIGGNAGDAVLSNSGGLLSGNALDSILGGFSSAGGGAAGGGGLAAAGDAAASNMLASAGLNAAPSIGMDAAGASSGGIGALGGLGAMGGVLGLFSILNGLDSPANDPQNNPAMMALVNKAGFGNNYDAWKAAQLGPDGGPLSSLGPYQMMGANGQPVATGGSAPTYGGYTPFGGY